MDNDIILCEIAIEIKEDDYSEEKHFMYAGRLWHLHDFLKNSFFDDILKACDELKGTNFTIMENSGFDDKKNLAIKCKHLYNTKQQQPKNLTVLRQLFPIIFKNYTDEIYLHETEKDVISEIRKNLRKKYVTTALYDALYNKHKQFAVVIDTLPFKMPTCFLPNLCPFQDRTVQWLLKREQQIDFLPNLYIQLEAKDNISTIHKHMFSVHVEKEPPLDVELSPGGILAEEMGLGKTVEVLALLLLNPRPNVNMFHPAIEPIEINPAKKSCIQKKLFCICVSRSMGELVMCSNCLLWQHEKCVTKYNKDHDDEINEPYLCPNCWHELTEELLVEAASTIIVTPNTIKTQWLSEIRRHINPPLRVLVYEGTAPGCWISPRQLANYDVVLTDYFQLRNEFYHTSNQMSDRITRHKPRFMKVYTPLTMVNWWRVCLDEAQMVESNVSKVTALVRMLPAVNRWAITGTPIQRSIDDLFNLLGFIGLHPVCDPPIVWNNLVKEFLLYHKLPQRRLMLIDVLQKCMWRTCKSNIVNELQIPPQTEVVHRINMDNLEKLFYTEQHENCENKFDETVNKYIQQTDEVLTISPKIMKIILHPLYKIRQSCTISAVTTHNNALLQPQTKFLQPKELHTHMKSTNEIECKSALRSMASAYNGIAALYFLLKNYDESISHYESVLKLAQDYNAMNVSVDSLLQIHALHNILQAYYTSPKYKTQCPTEIIERYEQQYNALEWKYLETYASNLISSQSAFLDATNALECIAVQTEENLLEFLSQLLTKVETDETHLHIPLLHKIYDEFGSMTDNAKVREIHSASTALYIINIWFDKVNSVREKLSAKIQSLKFFTDNVRARNQVNRSIWMEMMQFVNEVYDCHLSEIREKPKKNSDKSPGKATKKLCKLCVVRDMLNSYECLLFNKVIDEKTNLPEGLENPSMEICLIKVIFAFMKSKFGTDGINKHWETIECWQTLCKKLIKYWIEIEYTVKAYDELDMCKMRLSLTHDEDEKSAYKILEYEIDNIFKEQQLNLYEAQRQFTTKLARLKYIRHLETDSNPGSCPICHTEDEPKYVVLECGHHICLVCLKDLRQFIKTQKNRKLTCSICRNEQSSQKIYYVTRATVIPENEDIEISGIFSSKISYIVRLVVKLKSEHFEAKEEYPLKILIFSQWQPILSAIASAFDQNQIRYVLKWTSHTIENFKNPELGMTCLLMPFAKGSKGLNIIEATHVFLVEPILNPGDELQAIGRVHRFGQTKPTTVHRFIMNNTIEENIYNVVTQGKQSQANWEFDNMTIQDIRNLFKFKNDITAEF